MTDFVEDLGLGFFAHRLKRLSEAMVEGYGAWRSHMGVESPPKAASTMLLLAREGPLTVTEIATRLRLSHPLIIAMTRQLEQLGLVATTRDPYDRRRRPVALTAAGEAHVRKVSDASDVVARAYRALFADAGVDGLAMVEALERALRDKPFTERLSEAAAAAQSHAA